MHTLICGTLKKNITKQVSAKKQRTIYARCYETNHKNYFKN